MFEHMMKRHDVLFVYVGGESPLKVSTVYTTQTQIRIALLFEVASLFRAPLVLNLFVLLE